MSKGSKRRPESATAYRDGYDRAFAAPPRRPEYTDAFRALLDDTGRGTWSTEVASSGGVLTEAIILEAERRLRNPRQ